MEMERRGRARVICSLRFLVRPRRLETRTERGFPHFHSNYGYCTLTGLKGQPQQNHGVPQFLVQNPKMCVGKGEHVLDMATVANRRPSRIQLLMNGTFPEAFRSTHVRAARWR